MTVPLKVNIGQLAHDDIIIVTVGPTGSAKSSFINIASGSHCDTVGHSLVSRTCEVSAVKYTDDESGQRIVLVDTPGLNNTSKGDLEVQAMISQWLRSMKTKGLTISAILYFHRITDNRIAGIPINNLRIFNEICGDLSDVLQKTILTTTMWDDVDEALGKVRLAELQSTGIWKTTTTHAYKGDRESTKHIIRDVVQRVRFGKGGQRLPSRTGVAPVDWRASKGDLVGEMEALAERQLDILRNIRRDSMSLDPNTLNKLVHDYEELRTQMDGAWKQVRHKVEGPAHQMRNDSTIPVSQPKQSAAWRFPWR